MQHFKSASNHTLRTFRREITAEKLGLKQDQRLSILEIVQKLTYASSEEEYDRLYGTLVGMNNESVLNYYNTNWHSIKEQWVEGLKRQSLNLMTSTNNRVEGFNHKLKSVITKYSGMVTFFKDLKQVLAVLETERSHRALLIVQKTSVMNSQDATEVKYMQLLTPFVYKYLSAQLSLFKKPPSTAASNEAASNERVPEPTNTTSSSCQCGFFKSMGLPCHHIFRFRQLNDIELFDESLVMRRWLKDYYIQSHPIFESVSNTPSLPASPRVAISQVSSSKKPLAQHLKYRKAYHITQRLASLASEATGEKFNHRINLILRLEESWNNEDELGVIIEEAVSDVPSSPLLVIPLSPAVATPKRSTPQPLSRARCSLSLSSFVHDTLPDRVQVALAENVRDEPRKLKHSVTHTGTFCEMLKSILFIYLF
ncbi:unnamed protein product [Arctogadus glacialis]